MADADNVQEQQRRLLDPSSSASSEGEVNAGGDLEAQSIQALDIDPVDDPSDHSPSRQFNVLKQQPGWTCLSGVFMSGFLALLSSPAAIFGVLFLNNLSSEDPYDESEILDTTAIGNATLGIPLYLFSFVFLSQYAAKMNGNKLYQFLCANALCTLFETVGAATGYLLYANLLTKNASMTDVVSASMCGALLLHTGISLLGSAYNCICRESDADSQSQAPRQMAF